MRAVRIVAAALVCCALILGAHGVGAQSSGLFSPGAQILINPLPLHARLVELGGTLGALAQASTEHTAPLLEKASLVMCDAASYDVLRSSPCLHQITTQAAPPAA